MQRNTRERRSSRASISPRVRAITSYRRDLQSPPKTPNSPHFRNQVSKRPEVVSETFKCFYCTSASFSYRCRSRVFNTVSSSRCIDHKQKLCSEGLHPLGKAQESFHREGKEHRTPFGILLLTGKACLGSKGWWSREATQRLAVRERSTPTLHGAPSKGRGFAHDDLSYLGHILFPQLRKSR